jgi:type II secretory pathway component PulC
MGSERFVPRSVREKLRPASLPVQPSGMRAIVPVFGALALTMWGCGGAAPTTAKSVEPAPLASTAPAASATAPPARGLSRAVVQAAVAQGLGTFLQRVELDDQPVRVGGKFHGFRIASLHDSQFWRGIDLKPGDVVTSINGFPIERPEQALTAFASLDVASELRVAYDREGQPRELIYPIVDDH